MYNHVMELDPRKQTILRAVIFEYVREAEPVGSEALAQRYSLGVKSATIRNELADLADLGFLEQPHTSAGRVPSDRGYRYFVDRLIETEDPAPEAKRQLHGATNEGDAAQDLLADTTRVLSRMTQLFAAATLVRNANLSIKSAIVTALGPKQALLVVVFSNGAIENRMLEIQGELTLDDLGQANEAIAKLVVGHAIRTAARSKPSPGGNPRIDRLLGVVWSGLKSIAKEVSRVQITTNGEAFLLAQPEFQRDVGALTDLLEAIKGTDLLSDAQQNPTAIAQTVSIGREHRSEKLHQMSMVRQSFFVGENEAGMIAVIGPTRMAYEKSIPLVDFTAKALSEALSRFLA